MTRLFNYLFSPDHKMRTCFFVLPLCVLIGGLLEVPS